MPVRSAAVVVFGILSAFAPPAHAQSRVTTADLAGVILDETGSILPSATVRTRNEETNAIRNGSVDGSGRFLIPALAPGRYEITAEAPGFRPETRQGLVVSLGSAIVLRFVLSIGGLADYVSVDAPAFGTDSRATAVSGVISRDQIERTPTNGRDFLSFSLLLPGIATDRTPQQGSSATSGLTFAGQRARSNNIMVDGLDSTDTANGSVRGVYSQDAVREFQVLTSAFSAEFGKASAGVVNIVTRGGTNTLSGSGFLFVRDETLNAKEHFERFTPSGSPIDRAKAPYGQQQFGATIGGPLRKDRTFYFLTFERLAIDAQNFVNINDQDQVIVRGQPVGTAADIIRRAGFQFETGNVPYAVNWNSLFAKVNHQVGQNHAFDVRFSWASGLNENSEPWGGQIARSRGALLDSDDFAISGSYTAIASPTLVNEIRTQGAYRDTNVISLDPACLDRCTSEDAGGPTLEVAGVASVGRQRFTPAPRRTIRYEFLDTISLKAGDHFVRAGVDYDYINHPSGALPLHFGGRYIFAALPAIPGLLPEPITSIQALALGLPAAYVQGYGNSHSRYAVHELSAFAQDDWEIGRDLTVKAGLRYQNQFWPGMQFQLPGLGSYAFPSDNNNLAPRLGAAWNPSGNRRLAVHGAYGIFYDNQLTSVAGIADIVDGTEGGVRTLVLPLPSSMNAWNAPGHRLVESAAGPFPSLAIGIASNLKTPYAHHTVIGVNREWANRMFVAADFLYVKGRHQIGTLDYNPLVPDLGPRRRPNDEIRDGVAVPGTSASVLQYTDFGETWYRGLTLSVRRHLQAGYLLASYTWSKAEDNSTDYQSAFIPENTGKGRDPNRPTGLPIGFDPASERGPSLQDQRHRLVVSGGYTLPAAIEANAIVTVGSGRPYNILAGLDLNGDGNGGAFPPDRARRVPSDPASSVMRNSGTLPAQATTDVRVSRRFQLAGTANLEAIFEVFNLFNRTNFTEINNIFGPGPYPDAPAATYGQFERAAAPRQAQIAVRFVF
jgi:Carboxypeptidase regulatory-like domain/TonB dependent receptor-like, beta-barrel